jgi:Putative DNA-binding domain
MTDLFTADFTSLSNEMRYSAIADFAQALPFESSRHDFKETWGPKVVEDVAAFANTFGGILIIGVKKARKILTRCWSELNPSTESSDQTGRSPAPRRTGMGYVPAGHYFHTTFRVTAFSWVLMRYWRIFNLTLLKSRFWPRWRNVSPTSRLLDAGNARFGEPDGIPILLDTFWGSSTISRGISPTLLATVDVRDVPVASDASALGNYCAAPTAAGDKGTALPIAAILGDRYLGAGSHPLHSFDCMKECNFPSQAR